ADYTAATGTVSFAPGTTSQLVTVAVLGDLLDEANETFSVNLSAPTGATIADPQGLGTIVDNDPAPSIAIGDATVTEGNAGTTSAVFTVTLSAASGQTVTADFATTNGSAAAPGDYTPRAGTLTCGPGVTTQQITVAVQGDTTFENDENFLVELTNVTNATIDNGLALGTITNDDAPPAFAVTDVTVTETNTGATNAVFTVTLTGATALPATVSFTTANATAIAGTDYTSASGTLSFAPGTTSQLITVAVLGDTLSEPTETFTVNLSNPTNATIADGQGIGTILDNDGVPAISISNATVTEGNAGTTNAAFTVSLTVASAQQITVSFATTDGTATAPADYTPTSGPATFAPGTTTQLIAVPVLGDTLDEANETFTVTLSAATNATIATG